MNKITPRDRFKKNPDFAKSHNDLVNSEPFKVAVETALLEMQLRQSGPLAIQDGMVTQSKMEGAKEFISILLNLTEAAPLPQTRPASNLDHAV